MTFLYFACSQICGHAGVAKIDPLDCNSRFIVRAGNNGTLEFFTSAGHRPAGEKAHIPQETTRGPLTATFRLEGSIEYNEERHELQSIQSDRTAIKDTIVANFVDKRGRVAAEAVRNE